jgi:5-oxoprolinase (ATP-hydrolysing)/N-methylhydantoinase A
VNDGQLRVGIDIGGTFTDLALVDGSGRVWRHKLLTTPQHPDEAALRGLGELCQQAGVPLEALGSVVHATTLVTNALIERKGARTALLTTAGFRDLLEMGREQRYDIYDLFLKFPEPLVPRRWRVEVEERVDRDGAVVRPVDLAGARRQIARLVGEGVEAVAVAFLHAYRNPVHEQRVRDLVVAEFPDLAVSTSGEVCPEIREYERTCTTVCNAYAQPLVDRYLARIEGALHRLQGRLLLFLSSGTFATAEVARRYPVRLLESGPAAGALLAGLVASRMGRREAVAFDMGGTTAKISLVLGGRPRIAPMIEAARVHRFKPGSGIPIRTPVVDTVEIGAGGGSVARTDAMGLLKVGPESAGADPGPACYGRGGEEPTVTDACVVLGYFDPAAFLGGTMRLDASAARRAVGRLGQALGLDPVQAAWGIYAVVCENMAQAARLHFAERGQDPRRFTLVAFGGAGPAFAARLARLLGIREVVVPPGAGVASALGLLAAPPGFDQGRSFACDLADLARHWETVERLLQDMEEEGRAMVASAGATPGAVRVERRVELRYAGQFHDLEIPLPARLGPTSAEGLRRRFEEHYRALYGVSLDGYPVLALNWRTLVVGTAPSFQLGSNAAPPQATGSSRRPIYLPGEGFVGVPVYRREALPAGAVVEGPAVVEEDEATTLLWRGDRLSADREGRLQIVIGGQP